MSFRQITVSGFPAIALRSEQIEAIVIPSLGSKISNLRRLRGREWLWRNPQIPLSLPREGASYVETADSGGWDECFPTVGACPMPGGDPDDALLPDHGELWSSLWTSELYDHDGGTTLSSRVEGRRLPYSFTRHLTLAASGCEMVLRYQLEHLGRVDFPFLWSAHPLFNIQPGSRLTLPGVSRVRVDAVHGRDDIAPGMTIQWPLDGDSDGYLHGGRSGWAAKVFAETSGGRMVLTDPLKGEQFEMTVDALAVPQIGVWINAQGWAPPGMRPYENIGVEPCIGAPDRLDRAVNDWHMASILRVGEARSWTVTVALREAVD